MTKSKTTLKTGHIDLGSSKLYHETIGTGHPLILIHDGLVDCRIWDEPDPPAIGRLTEIPVPNLIIIGEEDIADNHAVSGVFQIGVKGSKRVALPNAGHLANLEQPEIFNPLVSEFIKSVLQ